MQSTFTAIYKLIYIISATSNFTRILKANIKRSLIKNCIKFSIVAGNFKGFSTLFIYLEGLQWWEIKNYYYWANIEKCACFRLECEK